MESFSDPAGLAALGLGGAQLQAASASIAQQPSGETPTLLIPSPGAFRETAIQAGPTKLFVGSIPGGTTREMLVEEFGKFGPVAEVFLKGAADDQGRVWAFVTFVSPQSAAAAAAGLNEKFPFPGALRPLAVSFARSSSSTSTSETGSGAALAAAAAVNPAIAPAATGMAGPTKLFIGSIPAGTTEQSMREEFGRFGVVMDVFLKQDAAEHNRMWGFVTYDNAASAATAVSAFHERLVLPGGSRPCAVSFARNSQAQHSMAAASLSTMTMAPTANIGATKLFIGTIPMGTTETTLRAEFEKYGQVTEVFLKNDSKEPNRMWGFLSYAEPQSAAVAVSALHEKLMMPGSVRPLAVTFAKNPATKPGPAIGTLTPNTVPGMLPVNTSSWKVYYTAEGIPYYHNASTGTTQWECPPDYPGGPAPQQASATGTLGLLSSQGTASAQNTTSAQGATMATDTSVTSGAPVDYAAMVGGVAGLSRASPY